VSLEFQGIRKVLYGAVELAFVDMHKFSSCETIIKCANTIDLCDYANQKYKTNMKGVLRADKIISLPSS
jgi:hypothetical protein